MELHHHVAILNKNNNAKDTKNTLCLRVIAIQEQCGIPFQQNGQGIK
jgi:hypothetical protein